MCHLFSTHSEVLPDGLKRHFHKVIRKYVTSETLGHIGQGPNCWRKPRPSALQLRLEGLTRSIISTYPCRDKWLEKNLMLRRDKGIRDAVEMVLKKELGGLIDQDTWWKVWCLRWRVSRNATAHTDLEAEADDYTEILFRWERMPVPD